jgi:hypothetical protein
LANRSHVRLQTSRYLSLHGILLMLGGYVFWERRISAKQGTQLLSLATIQVLSALRSRNHGAAPPGPWPSYPTVSPCASRAGLLQVFRRKRCRGWKRWLGSRAIGLQLLASPKFACNPTEGASWESALFFPVVAFLGPSKRDRRSLVAGHLGPRQAPQAE